MELLLSEAFAGDVAADRFRAGDMSTRRLRSSITLDVEGATGSQFFEALVEEGDRLREQTERRPYYRERNAGPAAPQSPLFIASVKERFARLVRCGSCMTPVTSTSDFPKPVSMTLTAFATLKRSSPTPSTVPPACGRCALPPGTTGSSTT